MSNDALEYAKTVVRDADAGRADVPRTEQLARALIASAQAMERDRSLLTSTLIELTRIMRSREWLRLGRGSYEYNDDRWRGEFIAAYEEIYAAIKTLTPICEDWSNCPQKAEEIEAARADLRREIERLKRGRRQVVAPIAFGTERRSGEDRRKA